MHSCGQCKSLTEATAEERRNRILRVRCGEITTGGRQKEERKTLKKYGTEAVDDFVIIGQTVSTFMKLPQIAPRGLTVNRRLLGNGKRDRISFMALNNFKHTVDDFHLGASRSATTGTHNHNDVMRHGIASDKMRRNSLDVRIPQTAPEGIQRRRWSDGGAVMPTEISMQTHQKAIYEHSLPIRPNGLNMIKSESCVVQSADEILREYKEFAKRRDGVGEGRIIRSNSFKASEWPFNGNYRGESGKNFIKMDMPPTLSVDNAGKPRPRRRNTSKLNLLKNKKGVIMPSGDSNSSQNSSQERIPTSGRTGSSATLLNRKSSKNLNRKISGQRKSELAFKNKKILPPKPESPPPGPSEEEMQELQELPVIRKFLKMPKSRPKVVCFDYPGVDLTHMDVKKAIENVVPDAVKSGKVVSIQFENVNVKLSTGGLENRWLIELRDFATRNLLIKNGLAVDCPGKNSLTDLKISVPKKREDPGTSAEEEDEFDEITFPPIKYPKKVQVKLNDNVAMEEYKLYLRRTAAEEKLQNVILLCAGRGDKLLTTML